MEIRNAVLKARLDHRCAVNRWFNEMLAHYNLYTRYVPTGVVATPPALWRWGRE
jgi:hypothetical protein